MKRVNVLFLNKFREVGGSEVFLIELIKHLDRDRFRPVVSLIGETSDEAYSLLAQQGIPIYKDLFNSAKQGGSGSKGLGVGNAIAKVVAPQGQRSPFDVTTIFRLARILRKEQIHILCYLDKHAALNLAPLAALLARTPIVVGSYHVPGLQLSVLERLLLPVTDLLTATSCFHRNYLVDTVRIPPEKIRIVNNGVSPERFKGLSAAQTKRKILDLHPDQPVAGILARLVPQKAHSVFLHSAAKVAENLPDARFLVIGDGPRGPQLETLAGKLGIAHQMHFLGYRNDIGQLLSLCDISVLSSDDEFFPYTILESMLMGVPVVSTSVGAIPEMISHGETGFLVPARDPDALAESMLALLSDKELRRQVGCQGKDQVMRNFTSPRMAVQIQKIFEELLERKQVAL